MFVCLFFASVDSIFHLDSSAMKIIDDEEYDIHVVLKFHVVNNTWAEG